MDKKEIVLKIKDLEEQLLELRLAIEEEPPRLEVGARVRIENPRPGQESEGTILETRPKTATVLTTKLGQKIRRNHKNLKRLKSKEKK
jgi:hypothetical protein